MANTRVKVRREVLIEKLTAERERIVSEHARVVEKYEKANEEYIDRLKREILDFQTLLEVDPAKALSRVEASYGRSRRDRTSVKFPALLALEPVTDDPDTRKIDRSLAVLRAAEDETLAIAADDEYAKFL